MPRIIQTVCGEIPPEKLGFCHSHEHIMLAGTGATPFGHKDPPYAQSAVRGGCGGSPLYMDDKQKSLAELELFASVGGCGLVDAQPLGCGRMSAGLCEISEKSGVHIIASTGFHKMMFYNDGHWIFSYDENELAAVFTHELQKGMFLGTDDDEPRDFHAAYAGIIKTALDCAGLDSQYSKLFSAAAKAHTNTGAPLLIHVEAKSDPIELDDFLNKHGVPPSKRIYCHLDRAVPDMAIHKELLERGCYLEYDTINRLKYHDNEVELSIIKAQLDLDFVNRILLGLDTTGERLKAYGGGMGLDYIKKSFIPFAMSKGIPEPVFSDIMVKNPSNAFAIDR